VAARPGTSLAGLVGDLLGRDIPVAIIDLDRSIASLPGTTLLERAARRHPGRLWLGGRLSPDGPAAARLLDAGARGVILGSSGLLADDGRLRPAALTALARLPNQGRVMVGIDVLGGHVVTRGFTRPSAVTAAAALDAVAQATGGRCPVLYTAAAAALRRCPPDWKEVGTLAASCPGVPLWYAGGLASWADMTRAWQAGLDAVTGRAYLTGLLGLPAHRGRPGAAALPPPAGKRAGAPREGRSPA
jgi:phosphoribosylformimino-5-aminoimidazole carboxamide ribonucleotide (ProFAR) isomerase